MEEIGAECFVSWKTVHNTLIAARERLQTAVGRDVKSTMQAAMIAVAFELLVLDSDGNVTIPQSNNYLFMHSSGSALGRRSAA